MLVQPALTAVRKRAPVPSVHVCQIMSLPSKAWGIIPLGTSANVYTCACVSLSVTLPNVAARRPAAPDSLPHRRRQPGQERRCAARLPQL